MGKKHPNVTHVSEVEPRVVQKGKFAFMGKRLAAPSGAAQLGCGWFEVPPGKTAFPHHYHCANEEGIYILEGQGGARIGSETVNVGPGDYISYPAGPESAHSLKNTGAGPLRYLCFSTVHSTEIVGYPDSKKIAGVGCVDPKTGIMGAKVKFIIKEQPSVDYYEGEE
ncbi:MAG: cupin domain-containing protein [Candidatus Omnitrophica bacterium]|nr:cupin domain-containing protein [Candidatus Omnitrophota bacterium]